MAQLTWRNVDAPSFAGTADAYRLMMQAMNGGFNTMNSALGDFQKNRADANSSAAAVDFLRNTTTDQVNAALASGEMSKYGTLNKDTIDLMAGRTKDMLHNQGLGIANDTNQFALSTTMRDDGQAQARLAAQPAAAKLLTDIRMLTSSGNPVLVEQGRQMLADNTQMLSDAGYRSDAFPGLLDAEHAAGLAGFGYKRDVLENEKFWESEGVSKAARDAAHKQINANMAPEAAIRNIQNDRSISDPRIKEQAIKVIEQAADSKVFATPDPTQMMLSSLGLQPGSVLQPGGRAPSGGGNGGGNVNTASLIRHFEGFKDTPYYDSNAYRTGYGSDTITRSDGSVTKVTPGMTVSREDAERDLDRRINTEFVPGIIKMVGEENWNRLGGNTQAALSSVAYNYGSLPNRVAQAVTTGDPEAIAQAVESLSGHNDGINAKRRQQEAAIIRGGGITPGMTATRSTSAPQAPAAPGITMPVGSEPGSSPAEQLMRSVVPLSDSLGGRPAPERAASAPEAPPEPRPTPSFRETEEASMALLRRDHNQIQNEIDATRGQAAEQARRLAEAAQTSATTPATAASATPDLAPASAADQVQTALDQSKFDRIFNGNAMLIDQVTNPQYAKETPDQVAKRLTAEDGLMPSGNHQAVLAAIRETMAMAGGNMEPHIAGALVANNAESRDLSRWFWWDGDRFSDSKENASSATRTNMEGVKENLKQLGLNKDGTIDLSRGVAQAQNQRASTVTQEQLGQVQQVLQAVQAEALMLNAAIQGGQDTPENRAALQQKLEQIQQLKQLIGQAGAEPSPTTIFSRAAGAVPPQ